MREEIVHGRMPAVEDRWNIRWSSRDRRGICRRRHCRFILVGFGAAVGLGVSSTSPTWRDSSAVLALLSGLYLILQAIIELCLWRVHRRPVHPAGGRAYDHRRMTATGATDLHGLVSWALAVLIGAAMLAILGAAAIDRAPARGSASNTTAAEPLLSYEIDKLFRAPRRAPNIDLRDERAGGRPDPADVDEKQRHHRPTITPTWCSRRLR